MSPQLLMSENEAALRQLIIRYGEATCFGVDRIEIHKLAYFLQVAGLDLGLRFRQGTYGPQTDDLANVLSEVEDRFVDRSSAQAGSFVDESLLVADDAAMESSVVIQATAGLAERIDRVVALAQGFESAYGMELLATVHWAVTVEGCVDRPTTVSTVSSWNRGNGRLFTTMHVAAALDRLVERAWLAASAFAG